MSMYKTVAGTIASVEHAGTSVNANPTYRVTLVGGDVLRTQTDASIGYGIDNPEYRNVPVVLTTTKSDRVVGVRTQDGRHSDGPQG